ncbi:hypothetical protein PAHAL_5G336100 [Panicum hallii]|uniref:Uncharacterized protein n=1 Tax=Panicum hallii TaxID=206008 RepID=A0A2T8IM29_9POAL|nr:hypothetical protein PAHAL_5G336100 [Panicum hallii]
MHGGGWPRWGSVEGSRPPRGREEDRRVRKRGREEDGAHGEGVGASLHACRRVRKRKSRCLSRVGARVGSLLECIFLCLVLFF